MPRIPMLGVEELSPSPHRNLVSALQELHAAAGWPSTRSISNVEGDFPATLSHEGVRSILSGRSLPLWPTLETLIRALVSMRHSAPRDAETEVQRFMPLWKAAKLGGYGAVELLLHGDAEGVRGDETGWVASDLVKLLVNPIYAIEIDPHLATPHEPLVSEEEWIAVNLRFISEAGPEAFLRTVLNVLKGGWMSGPEGGENSTRIKIDADTVDKYVISRILHRLGTEANLLGRCAAALDGQVSEADPEIAFEIYQLESEASILKEVLTASPGTWEELSHNAQRLVLLYLIDRVVVHPSLSGKVEEQIQIEWRIPVHENEN